MNGNKVLMKREREERIELLEQRFGFFLKKLRGRHGDSCNTRLFSSREAGGSFSFQAFNRTKYYMRMYISPLFIWKLNILVRHNNRAPTQLSLIKLFCVTEKHVDPF